MYMLCANVCQIEELHGETMKYNKDGKSLRNLLFLLIMIMTTKNLFIDD